MTPTARAWFNPATQQLVVRADWSLRPRATWRLDRTNLVAVDALEPWRPANLHCDLSTPRGRALLRTFLPELDPDLTERRFRIDLPTEPGALAAQIGNVAVLETCARYDPENAALWQVEADVHRLLAERFVDGIGGFGVDEADLRVRVAGLEAAGTSDGVGDVATLSGLLQLAGVPEVRSPERQPAFRSRGLRIPADRCWATLRGTATVKGWDAGPRTELSAERDGRRLTVTVVDPFKAGQLPRGKVAQPVRVGRVPLTEAGAPALDLQPEYVAYAVLYADQLSVTLDLGDVDPDDVLLVDLFRPGTALPTCRDLLQQWFDYAGFLFLAADDEECRDLAPRLARAAEALGANSDDVIDSRPPGGIRRSYWVTYSSRYAKWLRRRERRDHRDN